MNLWPLGLQVYGKTVRLRTVETPLTARLMVCLRSGCSDGDNTMSCSDLYNPRLSRYVLAARCTVLIAVSHEAAAVICI